MLAFIDLETRIPLDHPLRTIKYLADEALAELSPLFGGMYAEIGRPSIPPERLLKASLLISLYSVRSEYAFCEELEYHAEPGSGLVPFGRTASRWPHKQPRIRSYSLA
jgi:transposase